MTKVTTMLFVLVFGIHCGSPSPESVQTKSPNINSVSEPTSEPEPRDAKCDFSKYNPINLGFSTDGYATSLIKPQYPPEAKKQKVEGRVTVELLIDVQSGIVKQACFVKGDPRFENVSRDAALRSRFSFSGNKALPKQFHHAQGTLTYSFVSE